MSPRLDRRRAVVAALVTLVMPLEVMAQRAQPRECVPDSERETITGTVADLLSRRPLPGASVMLRRPARWVPEVLAVVEAGAEGRYAFCAEGPREGWDVVARLDTMESRARPVRVDGSVDTLYVPWSRPANLTGRVRMLGTDRPVAGARIEVVDRPVRTFTADDGTFRLSGMGAGPLVIRTTSLGMRIRVDTILAESGANVRLEIAMSADAIDLPPIVVTAARAPNARGRGLPVLGMTPEEVEAILPRSIDFLTMLRWSNTPGLLVQVGRDGTCVSFFRSSAGCAMLEVFVNGVRVSNASDYLMTLDPAAVREFIIIRPAFAQFQYMGPRTPNGVLDIILR